MIYLLPGSDLVSLRSALIRLLGGDPNPPDSPELQAEIAALAARLDVLEEAQHPTKLLEWLEVTEKLKRYLQRLGAVEQRLKDRQEGVEAKPDPVTLALLRSKYPHANGG